MSSKVCDQKTPVVIDGANVAFNYGKDQKFDVTGIQLAVNYFKELKHAVTVIVPSKYRSECKGLQDPQPCFAPPKSNDDDFIIGYARTENGIILSCDNYEEEKKKHPEWKPFVENCVLNFMFINGRFMPNQTPNGMPLEKFLARRQNDSPRNSRDENSSSQIDQEELALLILRSKIAPGDQAENKVSISSPSIDSDANGQSLSRHSSMKVAMNRKISDQRSHQNDPMKHNQSESVIRSAENTKAPEVVNDTSIKPVEVQMQPRSLSESSGLQQVGVPLQNALSRDVKPFETPQFALWPGEENLPSVSSSRRAKSEEATKPKNDRQFVCGYAQVTDVCKDLICLVNERNETIVHQITSSKPSRSAPLLFPLGSTVAYLGEAKKQPQGDCVYRASQVCLKENVMCGFGCVVQVDGNQGKIEAKSPWAINSIGRSQIIFSHHSVTEPRMDGSDGVLLTDAMPVSTWVRFGALRQSSKADANWIAINVTYAKVSGVMVWSGDSYGYAWSSEAGKVFVPYNNLVDAQKDSNVRLRKQLFEVGDWVAFRIMNEEQEKGCEWTAHDIQRAEPPQGFRASVDAREKRLYVNGLGLSCFINKEQQLGTVWCPHIGRMCMATTYFSGPSREEAKMPLFSCVEFRARFDMFEFERGARDECWWVTEARVMADEARAKSIKKEWFSKYLRCGIKGKLEKYNERTGVAFLQCALGAVFSRYLDFVGPENVNSYKRGQNVLMYLIEQGVNKAHWRSLVITPANFTLGEEM